MRQFWKFILMTAVLALFAVPAFAQTATPSSAAATSGTTIGIGDTVNGTLTTAQPSLTYTLRAEAGQAVNIHLTSDAFDAYLVLQDGNGNTLAENDDSDGTNAAIQSFVLPANTTYTIVAESYGQYDNSGAETGAFTLSVSEQHIAHIEYSQTVQDQLTTEQPSKDYVFTGQAGDVIVATQTSSDFDSYLHLLDSTGTELTSNDDSGGSLNSLLGPYTLPSTGSYTLRATSIDGTSAGAFSMTLTKTEVTAVAYDQKIDVSFTPNDQAKYFTFDATSGDLVTISADSGGSIDTSLTLNDPNNSQVATDDNGGAGFDPEIFQQLLSTSGTYTFVLQAISSGTGKVTLTVKHTAPPSLDEGPQTVAFSDSQTARAVAFTATAGETVRLNLHSVTATAGSPSVTITQGDTTVASASGSTVTDLNFSFKTSDAGPVVVQITDYSYTNLSYEVTLAHAANQ